MSVPTFDQFIVPVLRYLAEHPDGVVAPEACEAVAERMGLLRPDLDELATNGVEPLYRHRIRWAHDRLERAGLATTPRRGWWKPTVSGLAYAARHKTISQADVEQLAQPRSAGGSGSTSAASSGVPAGRETARERVDAALSDLWEHVALELVEHLRRAPPAELDRIVLDLLRAMGCGVAQRDLVHVDGAAPGTLEGVVSLDRLGLDRAYVQVQRPAAPLGETEVQAFVSALELHRANKGLFLATSVFTREAREAAKLARAALVLVDGRQLGDLLIEHGVGVRFRTLQLPSLDRGYFEEA
jgi:restriction system protein